MNGLFPIIRRGRYPLVPVEVVAEAKPAVVQAASALDPAAGGASGHRSRKPNERTSMAMLLDLGQPSTPRPSASR